MLICAAAGAAELRAVAVAQDLELLDRLERGIDEDRAVGADVVVVGAVDRPHVRGDVAAAHRQVGAAQQPLVLDVQEVRRADARHQRGELQEVAAVERQLADLLAGDEAGDVAADRLTGVDDASTLTTSLTSPGCSWKSSANSSATRSVTPVRLAALNPVSSADTL